nr:UPF0481 protein At3g47200-like [Ipomoea batatas]
MKKFGFGVADCLKKLKDLKRQSRKWKFLIKGAYEREGAEKYDPIFKICGTENSVVRDMLLLENQLPFFVLRELYDMISIPSKLEFSEMVENNIRICPTKDECYLYTLYNVNIQEIKHFLEALILNPVIVSFANLGIARVSWHKFGKQPSTGDLDSESYHIPTASELREAGVDFKKVGKIDSINSNETTSLFDINFNHSVLEIPSFGLYDGSESFFRNLIAYELYSPDLHPKYFVSFAIFMDDLINTDKDVILLRKKGIFVSGLGDDGTSAEDETARLYQEFVESLFQVDDVPGSKAFVRGGSSIPMMRS